MAQKNKRKVKQPINLEGLMIFLFVIGVLLISAYFFLYKPINEKQKAMDVFCQNNNYTKVTDWKFDSAINGNYALIECDEERIFYADYYSECIEEDKWHDCVKTVRRYK